MSDHLDFIRIRNLKDSDTEVFQGIGANGAAAVGTTAATTAAAGTPAKKATDDAINIWDEFMNLFGDLFDAHQKDVTIPDTPRNMGGSQSRQLALPSGGGSSWLFKAVVSLATWSGGPLTKIFTWVALNPGPAIAVTEVARCIIEVGDMLGEGVDDYLEDKDRNRLIEILETAFLKSEGIYPFNTEKSLLGEILKKGLLHLPPDAADTDENLVSTLKEGLLELIQDPTKPDELRSYLARLTEQDWRDLEIAFGDDVKLRVKGKTLHF